MKHLFFVGIAGHAMRGLAYAAQQSGNQVTGLDVPATSPGSDWLDEHGLVWTNISSPALLDGVDEVIISGGTAASDPILVEAAKRGLPVISFAEFLGKLTKDKRVISVAGSHGKTTTTAFITWLLESAGRQPDFLIGIQPFNFDSSARLVGSDIVVIEGDEYRASTLDERSKLQFYHPDVLVLTSVEMDHPDVFADLAAVKARFAEVIAAMPPNGHLIAWSDSAAVTELAAHAKAPVVLYGLQSGSVVGRNISYTATGIEFDLEIDGHVLGRLAVPLFGRHNVLNSLAAAAVAIGEGLRFGDIAAGAATFKGAYRRFNVVSMPTSPVTVIDDYAHHPTEVAATIQAAKLHFAGRRVVAIFRPHTYSRTKTLLHEFQHAFGEADKAYITGIEGAREAGQEASVSGADVATGIGASTTYEPDRAKLVETVIADAKAGDVILCMTVSGYDKLSGELAQRSAGL
ncbi:UDP-N-acetylmuramate--L-alanine ligase [Candidatus Saccharibacteria bacterium]|nr:UDP-N-acetylmuramate--L-alanine ligase [Candidatus Saccharibacteria bacterium]